LINHQASQYLQLLMGPISSNFYSIL
jgi:hypothetical protein